MSSKDIFLNLTYYIDIYIILFDDRNNYFIIIVDNDLIAVFYKLP